MSYVQSDDTAISSDDPAEVTALPSHVQTLQLLSLHVSSDSNKQGLLLSPKVITIYRTQEEEIQETEREV
jgi:hypothetical protein